MVKSLFGGSESKQSAQNTSSGGFGALPTDIQDQYKAILNPIQGIIDAPEQFFQSMGLTMDEKLGRQLMNPEDIQANIAQYLNPFQSRIEEDINRQFQAPQSALTQRASEAGAFGGSKYREGQTDLERARLDSLAGASANQYNNAYNQLQQGIGNLLGFGGLERGLDLQTKQALPSALSFASSIFAPLLSSREASGSSSGSSSSSTGIIPSLFG